MPRKTPAKLIELIEKHFAYIEYVEEILRVKETAPIENQASHVRNYSEEYWIGCAIGASSMLETALHNAGCYAGFVHMSEKKTGQEHGETYVYRQVIGYANPSYKNWRVRYAVRS